LMTIELLSDVAPLTACNVPPSKVTDDPETTFEVLKGLLTIVIVCARDGSAAAIRRLTTKAASASHRAIDRDNISG
jgi:hypothetical protein